MARGALHPHKMQSTPPLTSLNKVGSKNNIIILQQVDESLRVGPLCIFQNCTRTIAPNPLMSQGGKLAEAALIAATIRKL